MAPLRAPLLSLLAVSAVAFNVEFWGESNCAGAPDGSFTGGLGSGCQQIAVGIAEGATVESEGSSDDGASVAFYGSDDCNPSNVIAESNGGCVGIDDFAGSYKSFNVIGGGTSSKAKAKKSALTAQGRWDADDEAISKSSTAKKHGELGYFGADGVSRLYRWHQVAHGTWRGIDPADWDDAIHVKNDTKIDYSETYPIDDSGLQARTTFDFVDSLSKRDLSHLSLEERNFLYATCAAVRDCTFSAAGYASYGVATVATAFGNKLLQVSGTQNYWEFLNQPLVIALTIEVGNAAISGVVSAATSNALSASQCSSSGTDNDAVTSIMKAQSSQIHSLQESIQDLNGVIGKLSLAVEQMNERIGNGDTCSAPNPDPTTGKKRWIFASKK